jgi:hypothetical protein
MKQSRSKATFWSVSLLFLGTVFLVGCSGGFLSSNSSTSASQNAAPQNPPAGGQAMAGISGVVTQYNATQKTLTIRLSSGTTRTFTIGQATLEKSKTITVQALKTLLGSSSNTVRFTGKKSSSTTYTAQEVEVSEMNVSNRQGGNGFGGNPPTNGGTPPASGAQPVGTPPAGNGPGGPGGAPTNGTPPAGNGSMPANGTPGANGGPGGGNPGGSNGAIMLQNVKMQNNQLLATTFSGQSITVDLANSTKIVQQVTATASDLKAGLQVTVMPAQTGQNGSTTSARMISIVSTSN